MLCLVPKKIERKCEGNKIEIKLKRKERKKERKKRLNLKSINYFYGYV